MQRRRPDSGPVCVRHPRLFDRIHEGESKEDANERMAHAAHLCRVACPRLEQCREDRKNNPDGRVTGVIAGKYRGFAVNGRRASV